MAGFDPKRFEALLTERIDEARQSPGPPSLR
jgi:hypothetical protein